MISVMWLATWLALRWSLLFVVMHIKSDIPSGSAAPTVTGSENPDAGAPESTAIAAFVSSIQTGVREEVRAAKVPGISGEAQPPGSEMVPVTPESAPTTDTDCPGPRRPIFVRGFPPPGVCPQGHQAYALAAIKGHPLPSPPSHRSEPLVSLVSSSTRPRCGAVVGSLLPGVLRLHASR